MWQMVLLVTDDASHVRGIGWKLSSLLDTVFVRKLPEADVNLKLNEASLSSCGRRQLCIYIQICRSFVEIYGMSEPVRLMQMLQMSVGFLWCLFIWCDIIKFISFIQNSICLINHIFTFYF